MRILKTSPRSGGFLLLVLSYLFVSAFTFFHKGGPCTHIIDVKNSRELLEFFRYTGDRIPFISSHRGGPKKGLPENCIATFEKT